MDFIPLSILSILTLASAYFGTKEMRTVLSDIHEGKFIEGNNHHSWAHFGIIGMVLVGLGIDYAESFAVLDRSFYSHAYWNIVFLFGLLGHFMAERIKKV